jgi:carbonic anhydrase
MIPMKTYILKRIAGLACAVALWMPALTHVDAPSTVNADEAFKLLQAGNQRYVDGKLNSVTPEEMARRRAELVQGQKPFAVVVCCSDSRVGPEIIFDQELGNIFVVRTAGEVLDTAGIGSIEYAIAHLGSPLVLVLGHEHCGAVAAAVTEAKEPGHIAAILKAIQPAVKRTRGLKGDPVENAVRANVQDIAARLRATGPILSAKVNAGGLKIVGATFSLSTSKVELVPERQH